DSSRTTPDGIYHVRRVHRPSTRRIAAPGLHRRLPSIELAVKHAASPASPTWLPAHPGQSSLAFPWRLHPLPLPPSHLVSFERQRNRHSPLSYIIEGESSNDPAE